MLRYTLQGNDVQSVTLAEEMQFAEAYIFLMKMRYEENLAFRIDIDASMSKLLLPSMSVQLLIENAIKHNEISNRNPLTISIRTEGETLVVCNPIQAKRTPVAGPGIGLDNLANATACCGREKFTYRTKTAGSVSGFHYTVPYHESTDHRRRKSCCTQPEGAFGRSRAPNGDCCRARQRYGVRHVVRG